MYGIFSRVYVSWNDKRVVNIKGKEKLCFGIKRKSCLA